MARRKELAGKPEAEVLRLERDYLIDSAVWYDPVAGRWRWNLGPYRGDNTTLDAARKQVRKAADIDP